ncbi:MAG: cache domain-containing protein, partial [Candidatus Kariarchaeaceae archaeon]
MEEELKGLDRLSSDRALLVEEYINAVTTDLEVMFDYASALFQGNITAQVRDTYWADPAIMTDIPPGFTNIGYDPYEVGARSWEYSTIFLPEVQNEADLLALDAETQQLIDTSSALDFVFQAVHEANLDYIWIYAGFENDLFRQLPYNDVSWARDDPSTFEDETWYITDEPWYTETIAKDGLNVFLDEDPDFEILYVTAAKPIKNLAGDILGVIAVDLPIDILVDAISGDNILENGYAYMIDSQNEVLMHPLLAEDADVFGSSVTEIEFESSSERQEFEQVLVTIQDEGNGRETFDKNDELWYVAFAEVYDGEFSILVVVPEADILAAPQAISTSIFTSLRRQLIIFFLFMAVIAAIVAFMGTYASKRVVEPIKELTEVTELIAKGNLSKDLSEQYQSSSEITLLYESFRGLITTLRFGNQDYYAGDLNRAMSNYESALELFTNLNNNTGVGICYNNIGNIYRARG